MATVDDNDLMRLALKANEDAATKAARGLFELIAYYLLLLLVGVSIAWAIMAALEWAGLAHLGARRNLHWLFGLIGGVALHLALSSDRAGPHLRRFQLISQRLAFPLVLFAGVVGGYFLHGQHRAKLDASAARIAMACYEIPACNNRFADRRLNMDQFSPATVVRTLQGR